MNIAHEEQFERQIEGIEQKAKTGNGHERAQAYADAKSWITVLRLKVDEFDSQLALISPVEPARDDLRQRKARYEALLKRVAAVLN